MGDKKWRTFLIALGFFLIAVSQMTPFKVLNLVTGIFLTGSGFYLLKK